MSKNGREQVRVWRKGTGAPAGKLPRRLVKLNPALTARDPNRKPENQPAPERPELDLPAVSDTAGTETLTKEDKK